MKVKAVIKNMIEEQCICRVVIEKRDKQENLDFALSLLEPKICNKNVIILNIDKEYNPEELYIENQVFIEGIPEIIGQKMSGEIYEFLSQKYGKHISHYILII